MSQISGETVLQVFILFCRIGACIMLMPGFSSPRVPVQVRLLMAVAVTLALAPPLLSSAMVTVIGVSAGGVLGLILGELAIGVLLGLMVRTFFLALQFMAVAVAQFAGYGAVMGTPIEDGEPSPAIATLVTMTATVLFFAVDLHWEVLGALVASYNALPVTEGVASGLALTRLTDACADAFQIAFRLGSPFVVYSIGINLLFGLANKFTPQMPVYFISMPFVIAGGLLLLYFAFREVIHLFLTAFSRWLAWA